MIGDQVKPEPRHTRAAEHVLPLLPESIRRGRAVITIAGESGAGKSEIAAELSRLMSETRQTVFIFQQDDYFYYPPQTNARMRKKDIGHVGTGEVNLALLDEHVALFRQPSPESLTKPLVIFAEDRITEETIEPAEFSMAIAEGTYTTLLRHADFRIFIDRTYRDTIEHRVSRQRDEIDDFSEKILEIEHRIIAAHKSRADLIVGSDYSVTSADASEG